MKAGLEHRACSGTCIALSSQGTACPALGPVLSLHGDTAQNAIIDRDSISVQGLGVAGGVISVCIFSFFLKCFHVYANKFRV